MQKLDNYDEIILLHVVWSITFIYNWTQYYLSIQNEKSTLQRKIISCFSTLQFWNKAFSIVRSCHKTFHPFYTVGVLKHVKSHFSLIVVWLLWKSQLMNIYQNAIFYLFLISLSLKYWHDTIYYSKKKYIYKC